VKRTGYKFSLLKAARSCNMDEPRTPYVASKEARNDGVMLVTVGPRQHIVRTTSGEGAAILRNARRVNPGRFGVQP
jgi:hypothetical protein